MSKVVSYHIDYDINVQKNKKKKVDKTYFPIRGWTYFEDGENIMQIYGI